MHIASSAESRRVTRRIASSRWLQVASVGVLVMSTGCDQTDLIERLGSARPFGGGSDPAPAGTRIPFQVFQDDVGTKASAERRVLFKTKDAYTSFFGHAPPASVRFPEEWAIFYAAGTKPSGGFTASVESLALVDVGQDKLLAAVTRLESPGSGCAVTDAITTPHVLIKFAAQTGIFNVDFAHSDVKRNCDGVPTNPCAVTLCPAGTECVLNKSLPPQAICVPQQPTTPPPTNPCAAILCPVNSQCVLTKSNPPQAVCRPTTQPPPADPCATVRCRAGFHCEAQQVTCVRAPCNPVGVCVADKGPACGGFAGIKCPGSGSCVDDASDTCDPAKGGADCGGICRCDVRAVCIEGHKFDESPEVCACVKS
ncbi:MAG TPA: protease complex subunit PrcB family protein [Polyangia bacterium]